MDHVEKRLFRLLLLAGAGAIFVSMVAGPLNRTALAMGCAFSAAVISLCLVGWALYDWPKRR